MSQALEPNSLFSHYRILSKLGAGGMGEVYLAQDTSELGRTIALKILPSEVARDKDRLQRFIQEARTVSNLNHPNILTVHEFGQTDSASFMATEFVDGVILRQHLSNRRLKLVDMLDVAIQIVAALNAAHEAGVTVLRNEPPNYANLAGLYLFARKYDLGLEQARKTVALEPNHVTAKVWLGRAYLANGMYAEAISLSEASLATDPENIFFILIGGDAYAKSGRINEAEKLVRRIDEIGKRQYMERYTAATIYAALGEKDKAFAELEKSFANRDWGIARIGVDPSMDPLRDDPRFKDLVRRMGLPE